MQGTARLPIIFQNAILKQLAPESADRLRLRLVKFNSGEPLLRTGQTIRHLMFPESGLVSNMMDLRNGNLIEAGTVGVGGIVGASALAGERQSQCAVFARAAGIGYACRVDDALAEINRSSEFQSILINLLQAQLKQAVGLMACNAMHRADQRLARMLLQYQDQLHAPEIDITQEAISHALAVRRSTVAMAIDALRKDGILLCRRSKVHILDRAALLRHACSCYQDPTLNKITPNAASERTALHVVSPRHLEFSDELSEDRGSGQNQRGDRYLVQ